jgi:hypothetical protein
MTVPDRTFLKRVNTTELHQSWYPDPRGSGDGSHWTGTEWASGLPLGDRAVWDGGRDLGPYRFPAAGRRPSIGIA